MPYKIQIQYDDMENIASMFDSYADSTQEHIQKIEGCINQLQGDGWKGVGASQFYDEMESDVLPKLKILQQGYEVGGTQIRKVISMFEDAEQTILGYFASL
jgi:WXG100 family type VII secretion target